MPAAARQHVIECLVALPPQHPGEPPGGSNRGQERRHLLQQPRGEQPIGRGQRVGTGHQQAGDTAAGRWPPGSTIGHDRRPSGGEPRPAPLRGPGPHDGRTAREAQRDEFAPQPGRVAATLRPAPLQVLPVGIEYAAARRPAPGRHGARLEPLPDCLAVGADLAGDGADGATDGVQPHRLVEASLPACSSLFGPAECPVLARSDWRAGGILGLQLRHDLAADALDGGVVSVSDGMDGVAEVPQQVPAVADLDGLGRSLAHAVGINAGPVPGDDFNARVGLQPRGQALGPPVRQQVDDAVAFEVDEDRPVAVAAAPGPLVHRQHPHRRPGLRRAAGAPRHPQQRVGTGGHSQPRREAGADLAAGGEAEMALEVAQPPSPARRRRRGVGETFRKGRPRTGRLQASEAPGPYGERAGSAGPAALPE